MSTHWGYHCLTCQISSPHWLNHGEHTLLRMLEHRTIIAQAVPIFESCDIELSQLGVYDSPSPVRFLADHTGHMIILENEYGERLLAHRFETKQ